ncbi:MAG: hypothetical protein IPI23_09545 [Bacteroidetes bacterium]|nr:hypothetical protein [Bacteroidota bacterium]
MRISITPRAFKSVRTYPQQDADSFLPNPIPNTFLSLDTQTNYNINGFLSWEFSRTLNTIPSIRQQDKCFPVVDSAKQLYLLLYDRFGKWLS